MRAACTEISKYNETLRFPHNWAIIRIDYPIPSSQYHLICIGMHFILRGLTKQAAKSSK